MSNDMTRPAGLSEDGIMLTHRRVMCSVHSKPFQAQWPKGAAIFTVEAFRAVTAVPGIWDEARRLAGVGPDEKMSPRALEAVLDARPACCRLTPTTLVAVYEASKIGKSGHCEACGRKAIGGPVSASNINYAHVCFACVATASESPQGVQ